MTKNALDMIDEKIVELLQENARIAIKEIAAQVFLSSPAVTARIERLESKGIIKGRTFMMLLLVYWLACVMF